MEVQLGFLARREGVRHKHTPSLYKHNVRAMEEDIVYDLPAPCWDFTRRVARSMHTIRQPVTLGSSVPL